MATETITRLVDDLDGGVADRTVTFTWDGKSYRIDLSKKNISGFEKAIKPYVAAARTARPASSGSRRRGRSAAGKSTNLQAVREWARDNGYAVADRGRVAASIVDAYHAASN